MRRLNETAHQLHDQLVPPSYFPVLWLKYCAKLFLGGEWRITWNHTETAFSVNPSFLDHLYRLPVMHFFIQLLSLSWSLLQLLCSCLMVCPHSLRLFNNWHGTHLLEHLRLSRFVHQGTLRPRRIVSFSAPIICLLTRLAQCSIRVPASIFPSSHNTTSSWVSWHTSASPSCVSNTGTVIHACFSFFPWVTVQRVTSPTQVIAMQ
jgi:hypothetical protein